MGCGKSKSAQTGEQDELTVVVNEDDPTRDENGAAEHSKVQPFLLDKSDEEISEEGSHRKENSGEEDDTVSDFIPPQGVPSQKPRTSFNNAATKIGKVSSMWSSKRFSNASQDLILEDMDGSASPIARTSQGMMRASMSIQGNFLSTAFHHHKPQELERRPSGPPKVTGENAYTGMMVALDLEVYGLSGLARFPGDAGPGVLLEDHFGDGSCWRVRWVLTNSWGIYYTGLCDEYHLFVGADKATQEWDPEAVNARGRMPSMFFCVAPPKEAESRNELIRYSSPRSRVLTSEEMF